VRAAAGPRQLPRWRSGIVIEEPTILHEDRRADLGIGRERVARYIPVGEGSPGIPVVKPSNPGLIRGRFANPARSFPELLQKCVHFYTLFPDTHFAPDLRRTGHFTWRCKTLMYANGKRNRRGVGGYRVAGKRTPVLISMLRRYFVNLGYQFSFFKNLSIKNGFFPIPVFCGR
jgi:hypothetical protein